MSVGVIITGTGVDGLADGELGAAGCPRSAVRIIGGFAAAAARCVGDVPVPGEAARDEACDALRVLLDEDPIGERCNEIVAVLELPPGPLLPRSEVRSSLRENHSNHQSYIGKGNVTLHRHLQNSCAPRALDGGFSAG